jgi:hypothetical protein
LVVRLVDKLPRIVTFSLIAVCIGLMVFSTGNQNATALETISVQILPPSETTIIINTEVQLTAQANGGPGAYEYRWSANDVAINSNFTSATCTFNVTQIGPYKIECLVRDATGVIPGYASAPEIYVYAIAPPMLATVKAPTASPETSSGNQDLTIIIASVIVIAVIGAATIIIIKQKKPKQSNTP